MPKGILEFQLPEEREEFDLARQGARYSYILDEIDEFLRSKIKYGDLPEEQHAIYVEIRHRLWELRNDE